VDGNPVPVDLAMPERSFRPAKKGDLSRQPQVAFAGAP
jgi:hypothetical protein